MARWIMIAGLILLAVGAILHFAPGLLGWFGKLPGDIHMKTDGGDIYIPITSMLIISLLLTLLINLFKG